MNQNDKFVKPWTDKFNEQIDMRIEKRKKLEALGRNPYSNHLRPDSCCADLKERFKDTSKEQLVETNHKASLAGRAMLVRDFGKAAFVEIDDGKGRFQIYVSKNDLPEGDFNSYKLLDTGDIVYATGTVFRTNKGELSLHATQFHIMSKSLRPLPEKFHGLSDPELRYRMRYVDTIMNEQSRDTLRTRAKIVRLIRDFFHDRDYIEVETPMLHTVAGGAAAKPFTTHHNALDMGLSLRIAPELHLKRLVVGGYPRVFEMNRCFRNEGLSIKHNPEFTSIEFYQAYATYKDLMELSEQLLSGLAQQIHGKAEITYGERTISMAAPFARMTMKEAVAKYTGLPMADCDSDSALRNKLKSKGKTDEDLKGMSAAKLLVLAFEEFAEGQLVNPTFITEFPTEVSPLSRRNDENPEVVDRFELFINGWEVANAFSELNNPTDQLDRFADQAFAKEQGDEEACEVDYDYVRALEYGLAPTAGEGIGIDRLVMLLTNSPSIRDVIFFPLLKKEEFI